jgi:hypothetical protein
MASSDSKAVKTMKRVIVFQGLNAVLGAALLTFGIAIPSIPAGIIGVLFIGISLFAVRYAVMQLRRLRADQLP